MENSNVSRVLRNWLYLLSLFSQFLGIGVMLEVIATLIFFRCYSYSAGEINGRKTLLSQMEERAIRSTKQRERKMDSQNTRR